MSFRSVGTVHFQLRIVEWPPCQGQLQALDYPVWCWLAVVYSLGGDDVGRRHIRPLMHE
jgi:hypothetical protein